MRLARHYAHVTCRTIAVSCFMLTVLALAVALSPLILATWLLGRNDKLADSRLL